ncbi:MAG: phospho-sugar mutase [Firmicutes bacterium]|nr:phospho-sugar mutase [Bacillota bacterium]
MADYVTFARAYEALEHWMAQPDLLPVLQRELQRLIEQLERNSDAELKDEICDRFHKHLEYGTGGLRSLMGAGNNRFNIYTVRWATQAICKYLLAEPNAPLWNCEAALTRDEAVKGGVNDNGVGAVYSVGKPLLSMAVAYDSRTLSDRFALETAGVLLANGFRVYLFPTTAPAPLLSFAVRHFGCRGGIMITAGHNPSTYNGYRLYDSQGCPVPAHAAADLQAIMNDLDVFKDIQVIEADAEAFTTRKGPDGRPLLNVIGKDLWAAYEATLLRCSSGVRCEKLEVVTTPLNGTGSGLLQEVLHKLDVAQVHAVPEQEKPDPNFTTCPVPNPEKQEALRKGLTLCETLSTPDLLLASDPDCGRLGTAVRLKEPRPGKGTYQRLTSNQLGILLLDFLCSARRLPDSPVLIKSVLATPLADAIAARYGLTTINVLPGFSHIGRQLHTLEKEGRLDSFVFAFDGSGGFLSNPALRDKDALNAAFITAEMAAYYKNQNKTLTERLEELYRKYGYFLEKELEISLEGHAGSLQMEKIMKDLRRNTPETVMGSDVIAVTDFLKREDGGPTADIFRMELEDGGRITVRPSSTESRLKITLSTKEPTPEAAAALVDRMELSVKGWIKEWSKSTKR